jgi:hypothetical protein
MVLRRVGRLACAAAVTAALGAVTGTPLPAAAASPAAVPHESAVMEAVPAVSPYENDTAVYGGDPAQTGIACNQLFDAQDNYAAEVCFHLYGDQVWVYDARGDGHAAIGQWSNYLRDADGTWIKYREGECRNSLGHGQWGVCNKEFFEDSTNPNAEGGHGSGLRLWACTASTMCNADYTWVRNNA